MLHQLNTYIHIYHPYVYVSGSSEMNGILASAFSEYTSYVFGPHLLALEIISRHHTFSSLSTTSSCTSPTSYNCNMSQNSNLSITDAKFATLTTVTVSDTTQTPLSTFTSLAALETANQNFQSLEIIVNIS